MQVAFKKKQRNLSALVALFCLGIVAIVSYLFAQIQSANWWVSHSLLVMQESERSLVCLMDCETAYRGYLVTGRDEYLAPYEKCFGEVDSHIKRIAELTADNPRQQAVVPQLRKLASEKIKFSQQVIAARRANQDKRNWKSGAALVDIAPGKELMDKFRVLIDSVQSEETRLLAERQDQVKQLSLFGLCAILLLCAAIFAAAYWIVATAEKFAKAELDSLETLTNARDQAIQSTLLKSQFVANVSHEIRTPLSGMLGICELLAASDTTSDTKELSSLILDAGRKLMTLINDLLDFSKMESGKFTLLEEDFSVELVLHDVAEVMRPLADSRDIKLSVVSDRSLEGSFIGDSYRIRQVLLNLVNNGIKFTKQGEVVVSAKVVDESGTNANVRFEVKDTGIGISQDQIVQLFEPYVQADGSMTTKVFGGTGLGLSISKKLAELMHGSLGCESEKGKGSTFWFVVPLKRSEVLQSADPVI
ncbi:MAG: CHASE3 domain-containing protein [Candidatus Melainabacteria bacterium]|nr:CHASE3 domain-containing protein [Candidatus Melainabacteria bacterium]